MSDCHLEAPVLVEMRVESVWEERRVESVWDWHAESVWDWHAELVWDWHVESVWDSSDWRVEPALADGCN